MVRFQILFLNVVLVDFNSDLLLLRFISQEVNRGCRWSIFHEHYIALLWLRVEAYLRQL